jgi:hypothetical protein
MIPVHVQVQHDRALDLFNFLGQPLNHFRPAAFAEIRHTLDKAFHHHENCPLCALSL